MKTNLRLILFSVSIFLFSKCRIQYSFTGADIPTEAKSATVTLFINNAGLANPNLPMRLTETLKDQILAQSKLYISQSGGDLQFSGFITGYDVRPVAVQANETAGLNRLTITITVTYSNKFDEKKNFTQNFTRFADYNSSLELSTVEDQLITDINKILVQDIFDRAFGNW